MKPRNSRVDIILIIFYINFLINDTLSETAQLLSVEHATINQAKIKIIFNFNILIIVMFHTNVIRKCNRKVAKEEYADKYTYSYLSAYPFLTIKEQVE